MIEFNCEKCGKQIRAKPELAGRTGKCTGCGASIEVPSPEAKGFVVTPRSLKSSRSNRPLVPSPPAVASHSLPHRSPDVAVQVNIDNKGASDGLGISSLIVGILSFFVCWIPVINFGMGGLGLLLGIAGLILAMQNKGHGIGYSIAGTAISSVSFIPGLLFLFVFSSAMYSVERAANSVPTTNAPASSSTNPRSFSQNEESGIGSNTNYSDAQRSNGKSWTLAPNPLTLGNVTVNISEARIGKVPLVSAFDQQSQETDDEYLIVRFSIRNNDPNKKVNYRGWMSDFASLSGITASLQDEHGNRYKFITAPAMYEVKNAESKESIYPGKTISDAVVFETPVASSNKLFLTLSAKGCEEEGEFNFEISRSFLERGSSLAPTNGNGRTSWVNVSYKSRIVKVAPKKWQEIRDDTKAVVWNYDELDETPEYIEVFLRERKQTGRIYKNRFDLFIDNNWVNAAIGRWER